MKTITPAKYAELTPRESIGYYPVYAVWKKRKQRVEHYCDCNGCTKQYDGWETVDIPIGEPIQYKRRKPTVMDEMVFYYQDRLFQSATKNIVINPS